MLSLLAVLSTIGHATSDTSWIPVRRGAWIDFNLESTPLEITTDSELGSNDWVDLWFYSSGGDHGAGWAGGISLKFSPATVRYFLLDCSSGYTGLTTLPSDRFKVWRVSLIRTSGVTLLLHCNDVEVLRVGISGDVCDRIDWSYPWSRTVEQIYFAIASDSASDFYRAQP